jgi:hypothetical protein
MNLMKNVNVVVSAVTIYALLYQLAILMGAGDELIFTMFSLSPFLVGYMVYVILKYGVAPKETFDEKFYCDWDYRRNGREEMPEAG